MFQQEEELSDHQLAPQLEDQLLEMFSSEGDEVLAPIGCQEEWLVAHNNNTCLSPSRCENVEMKRQTHLIAQKQIHQIRALVTAKGQVTNAPLGSRRKGCDLRTSKRHVPKGQLSSYSTQENYLEFHLDT